MRIVVGISGATGAIYGIKMLEILHELEIETHLIISEASKRTIQLETNYEVEEVEKMAAEVHDINNIGASISSGSFKTSGMIIAPCAIKTLSAIANSFNTNLLIRAADVVLKERRKLVLLVRETPLHLGHLRLMTMVTEAGGILLPPMPAFYNHPQTMQDLINQTVGKVLDQFDIDHNLFSRWQGVEEKIKISCRG
ncbi:MAG: UbiX family flavin prenyltransferase [Bacillota bacterium]|nr:UbiX family flavin prenyltransferase [Bacillota bacterium]